MSGLKITQILGKRKPNRQWDVPPAAEHARPKLLQMAIDHDTRTVVRVRSDEDLAALPSEVAGATYFDDGTPRTLGSLCHHIEKYRRDGVLAVKLDDYFDAEANARFPVWTVEVDREGVEVNAVAAIYLLNPETFGWMFEEALDGPVEPIGEMPVEEVAPPKPKKRVTRRKKKAPAKKKG